MRGMVRLVYDPLPPNRRLLFTRDPFLQIFNQSQNEAVWNNNLQSPNEEPPRLNVNTCCRPGEEIYIRSGI